MALRFNRFHRFQPEENPSGDDRAANRDGAAEGAPKDRTGPLKSIVRLADAVNRSYAGRAQTEASLQADDTRAALADIAVIAFVGPSGTGKSTRASAIAQKHQIDYLIDDGLLIRGNRIIAGTSAKKAHSRLESVRQALFADETRAANVRRALIEHHPTTLMILGTSDGMLEKICRNLWLNPPSMLIRIEDVSSDEEMRLAKQTRMTEGRHTIPVPSMEIKHEFSGYFADPISRLRRRWERERGVAAVHPEQERTVVRPTFSALGRYSISDEAMRMMIAIALQRISGVAALDHFAADNEVYGVILHLDLALFYGYNAQQVLHEVQRRISQIVEDYTSINVISVNVKARRVIHAGAQK